MVPPKPGLGDRGMGKDGRGRERKCQFVFLKISIHSFHPGLGPGKAPWYIGGSKPRIKSGFSAASRGSQDSFSRMRWDTTDRTIPFREETSGVLGFHRLFTDMLDQKLSGMKEKEKSSQDPSWSRKLSSVTHSSSWKGAEEGIDSQ